MDFHAWFQWSNQLALLGWIFLLIALFVPKIQKWAYLCIIPILHSLLYLYLFIFHFDFSEGGFGSLPELMILFTKEGPVLAGWEHYLAFDLWIGTWQVANSKRFGINSFLLIPCLILTFMAGPVGLLLYLLIRAIKTKRILENDNFQFRSGD